LKDFVIYSDLILHFSPLPCPKSTAIQTQLHLFPLVLSKLDCRSDSIASFPPCLVQTRLPFRLNYAFSPLSCPNSTTIQTQLCLLPLCLVRSRLPFRLNYAFSPLVLSELNRYSDSTLSFPPCLVRTQPPENGKKLLMEFDESAGDIHIIQSSTSYHFGLSDGVKLAMEIYKLSLIKRQAYFHVFAFS
jgi:hypothetical protein